MLIVKREMASVLRGPVPVTLRGCGMFISVWFFYQNSYIGICSPGKLGYVKWFVLFFGGALICVFAS